MHRITIKDCKVQLDYINKKLYNNTINVNITKNGIWKNLYQCDNLLLSAKTYSELYYQLVAFKLGTETALANLK